jgi:hypothetical protein
VTSTEIQELIASLVEKRLSLDAEGAQITEALAIKLVSEPNPDNEAEVQDLRRRKSVNDEQRAEQQERIDALEAALPGAILNEFREQARSVTGEIQGLHLYWRDVWARYVEASELAEGFARQMVVAEAKMGVLTVRLQEIQSRSGLRFEIPSNPRPLPIDAEIAHLVGLYIGESAFGEPSDGVLGGLSGARARKAARTT